MSYQQSEFINYINIPFYIFSIFYSESNTVQVFRFSSIRFALIIELASKKNRNQRIKGDYR